MHYLYRTSLFTSCRRKATLRNIDGHITRELLYTPSFVNVHYNDGTTTQQFVEWEPLNKEAFEKSKRRNCYCEWPDQRTTGVIIERAKATLIITIK